MSTRRLSDRCRNAKAGVNRALRQELSQPLQKELEEELTAIFHEADRWEEVYELLRQAAPDGHLLNEQGVMDWLRAVAAERAKR